MKTDHTITGKWRRLARLAPSMGSLGLNVLLEHLVGSKTNHETHSEAIKTALGSLKGPMMKIAQMLASIPGALPDEYVETFKGLQAQAPPMSEYFAQRMIGVELGDAPNRVFKEFHTIPIAAASLGQVHQAKLKSGAEVVCKIQYPDMEATVEADLSHVHNFLKMMQSKNKGVEATLVLEEIKERLYEELDYEHEASNIIKFRKVFENFSTSEFSIAIPGVHSEHSTQKLLIMDYLRGQPIHEVKEMPLEWRNSLAKTLFKAWYFPFYRFGIIHGDSHSGNFSVNKTTNTLNILDFGCVRIFPPTFVSGVISLYRALQKKDNDACMHAYEQWGFTGLTKEVVEILNTWAEYLYAPLLDDRVRPISENHSSAEGKKIAANVFKELRARGGVVPPQEFVLLDRATVGMGGAFMTLQAEVNWHQEFEELISGISVETISHNQKAINI